MPFVSLNKTYNHVKSCSFAGTIFANNGQTIARINRKAHIIDSRFIGVRISKGNIAKFDFWNVGNFNITGLFSGRLHEFHKICGINKAGADFRDA